MSHAGPSSQPHRRVPISILPSSNRALVWSPSDVLFLRSHHRIIGILTGSLPLLPQQNAYLGVPLQLMPEEVALLLQRDAAILIDESKAYGGLGEEGVMTEEQWQQWQAEKEESIRNQKLEAFKQNKDKVRRFEEALAKSAKAKRRGAGAGAGSSAPGQPDQQAELQQSENQQSDMDPAGKLQAVEQKRQQRQRERLQRAKEADKEALFAGEEPSDAKDDHGCADGEDDDNGGHEDGQEASEAALAQYNYTHTTQDSSQGLPWYDADSASTLASSSSSTLAQRFLPSRGATNRPLLDTTKQQIFTDLNTTHHYYLSCGLRFGGDFVAYPGDPFRYHSHYTVSVLADERSPWSAAKLVADGRLGTGVKKVHVVATVVGGKRAAGGRGVEEQGVEKVEEGQKQAGSKSSDAERTPRYYSLTWAGFGT